jgi:large subunit ribosomal protein L3
MQINSLIGKKTYQKQGFLEDGRRVPLTGVVVKGNFVTQIKTSDKEGYNALQVGIDIKKRANKTTVNHIKKAGLTNTPRFFREIKVEDLEGATLGSELNVSEVFNAGDIVDVTGISKGKGWAGGVKRWGFKGGPRTHGQSDRERAPGSIGQTTTPGRVYKGKKMAGRMGQDTVTVKNLEIIEVTSDGVLLIKGLVPGSLNSLVVVKKIGENKKFVPLYKEVKEEETVKEEVAAEEPEEIKEEPKEEAVEEVKASEEAPVEVAAEEKTEEQASEEPVAEDVKEEVVEEAKEENGNS